MGSHIDSVPFSGLIRIRDMMYSVERPFRLDQGDLSLDAPGTLKNALTAALAGNHTHYVQTVGIPPLIEALAGKLRTRNRIPVDDLDHVCVTTGGIHGVFVVCQALFEEGDEVLIPDPEWPPCRGNLIAARVQPVPYPLYESRGWRPDIDQMRRLITPRTQAIYVNTPNNPAGGVLTRADLDAIAELAVEHDLWVLSDEAYEDVLFDDSEHISIASLPGMYDRVISIYTFSKTYAMTGLRLGYVVVPDATILDRVKKLLFYTVTNTTSVVQYAGLGALTGSQDFVRELRCELAARRDLFYDGLREAAGGILTGEKPPGAFYAFLRINPDWQSPLPPTDDTRHSRSWAMAEFLITRARIGCVPGVDFGAAGEGYLRFCFARERAELTGALASMKEALA